MTTGALLADLRRTNIGDFDVDKALLLDKISEDTLQKYRLDTNQVIKSLGRLFLQ